MKFLFLIFILNFSHLYAKSPFDIHKNRIKGLKTIYVLTDTIVVDDMEGNQIGLDTNSNFEHGKIHFKNLNYLFNAFLSAELIHLINSVGLYEQDNVFLLDTADQSKKIILPKFDETVNTDKHDDFIKELNPLSDRAFDMSRPSRMHKKYQTKMRDKDFSRIDRVSLNKDEAVLMLLTSGIKVPGKKTAGKAALVGLLTLGTVIPIESSATTLNTVLIANDGTLLWAGKGFQTGKSNRNRNQFKLLIKSFKGFPLKLQKIKRKFGV